MKRFKLMQAGVADPVCQVEVEEQPLASTLDAWAAMGGTIVEEDITAEASLREVYRRRRREYPPLEDFADAYFHLRVNNDQSVMEAYLQRVAAVKARFPKP